MLRKNVLTQAIVALTASLSAGGTLAQGNSDTQVEEIVVQGFRASLAKATEEKRSAASIQDSIVAEDIGKFPDQNVAESLQRITGVSISRSNGEGSKVTVRGFGPAFNTVRVNNRILATSEGGREFDFQVLPSELISGADVIKSPTANLEAGSIGAYINIKTARPLDHKGFTASGTANIAYGELAGKADPEFSGLISDTFADDTIGVMLGLSHKSVNNRIDAYRTNRWSDSYTAPAQLSGPVKDLSGNVDSNTSFRRPGRSIFEVQEENRERTGVNAVLQWVPNENWVSTLDMLYTDLSVGTNTSGVQIPNQSTYYKNVVIDSERTLMSATITDNNIDLIGREIRQDATTQAVGFNSQFTQDNLTLKFDASISKAKSTPVVNESVPHFTNTSDLNNRAINLDYSKGDVLNVTSTIDVADINNIRSHWNGPGHNEIEDKVNEFKFDGIYELDKGVIKSMEAGIGYASREKSNDAFHAWSGPTSYACAPCGGPLAAAIPNAANVFGVKHVDNFLGGESGTFPHAWVYIKDQKAYDDAIQKLQEQNWYKDANDVWQVSADRSMGAPLLPAGATWKHDYLDAGGSYANKENSFSGYTQVNLASDDFTGNIGLRYISLDNTSKGFGQDVTNLKLSPNSSNEQLSIDVLRSDPKDKSASSHDNYFLPSANFSFILSDNLFLRTAMAKTITRPAISDTGVNQDFSVGTSGTVLLSGSNPYLRSYEANQLDLSLEYYADNGDAYSAALFHKEISSFISSVTTVGPYTGPIDPAVKLSPAYPSGGLVQTSTIKRNRQGGTIDGLEIGALHHMDYLPGLLSGLGVQANYTYATSKDDGADPVNQPAITEPGSALEGFAKNSYNFTVFYEQGELQARIAYNWRDTFMSTRDGVADSVAATLPLHTLAYGQFDASVSYEVMENITLSLEAINLTNERRLEYVDTRSRVSLLQYTGARYQAGVRVRF